MAPGKLLPHRGVRVAVRRVYSSLHKVNAYSGLHDVSHRAGQREASLAPSCSRKDTIGREKVATLSTCAVLGNRSMPVTPPSIVARVEQRSRIACERRNIARNVDNTRGPPAHDAADRFLRQAGTWRVDDVRRGVGRITVPPRDVRTDGRRAADQPDPPSEETSQRFACPLRHAAQTARRWPSGRRRSSDRPRRA